ncbi:MAG TPA: hypothetical protein VFA72_11690, partial [Burkholderiales bacterium]|nr:hypothetical protein [Burkholderiales bacterium]
MREIDLQSWAEFEEQLRRLEAEREGRRDAQPGITISPYLYRGHADSRWKLDTTLERAVSKPVSLRRYYRLISAVKPKVETFTDREWTIPTLEQY